MKHMNPTLMGAALICLLSCSLFAQTTAFTYQGRLDDNGTAVQGSYDLMFGLFGASTGPAQVGGTITSLATAVSNGLFTVTLDFGDQFPGAARWLDRRLQDARRFYKARVWRE